MTARTATEPRIGTGEPAARPAGRLRGRPGRLRGGGVPIRTRRLARRCRRGRAPGSPPRDAGSRRDESGLTTLEWLLIVAAVAGLAALAVVLVTNVVDDTSEQISGSSARQTAAQVAAQEIVDDAADADQPDEVKTWADWERYYNGKCDRLSITYGDADITVRSIFEVHSNIVRTVTPRASSKAGVDFDVARVEAAKSTISPTNANGDVWDPPNADGDIGLRSGRAMAVCAIS